MNHMSIQSNMQCTSEVITQETQRDNENNIASVLSKEIISQSFDVNSKPVSLNHNTVIDSTLQSPETGVPLLIITKPTQQSLRIVSNLPSHTSLNLVETTQPLTLFLQAMAKLNESSISLAERNDLLPQYSLCVENYNETIDGKSIELPPPDSLTNAPPSYSFVLRQIAARRRRRLMGTFIPSPSFVQHTPPPNYATAFDIYMDSPLPPPTTRTYSFGFTPIPIVCPECGFAGVTTVDSKITLCTHLCAIILCLLCCWICAPLPYVLRSCKDVYHYCRNCRSYLGMYCPTSTENS